MGPFETPAATAWKRARSIEILLSIPHIRWCPHRINLDLDRCDECAAEGFPEGREAFPKGRE